MSDSFESFIFDEKASAKKDGDNAFVRALEPDTDFLPGAMLADNELALKAAQSHVEDLVRAVTPGIRFEWNGTVATARVGGEIVDRIEIHGATWSKSDCEVAGVRFDATGVKLNAAQDS